MITVDSCKPQKEILTFILVSLSCLNALNILLFTEDTILFWVSNTANFAVLSQISFCAVLFLFLFLCFLLESLWILHGFKNKPDVKWEDSLDFSISSISFFPETLSHVSCNWNEKMKNTNILFKNNATNKMTSHSNTILTCNTTTASDFFIRKNWHMKIMINYILRIS